MLTGRIRTVKKMNDIFASRPYLPYIFIVLLVLLSAFFSGSEIAFASVNKRRLRTQADEGSKSSKLALKINEKYEDILPTILIGNNLVNIASSSIATVIALSLFDNDGIGTTAAAFAMTVIILIFGEIVPKLAASNNSLLFSKAVSYPLQATVYIFSPVVFIVSKAVKLISKIWDKGEDESKLTEDELLTIIETVEDEGVIDEDKSELLQSAIEYDDITVREILTPRVDMFAVDADEDKNTLINSLLNCKFSRIPVYKDTVDNIAGIIYLSEILKAILDNGRKDFDINEFLHEAIFFPQSMKLDNVLKVFKDRKLHMAIVTDEYGGTMGLVTFEDVIEEIVGDIWDEKDTITSQAIQISDNLFEISGDMAIFDFCDLFDISEDSIDCDSVTVGGLAMEMLDGRYPEVDDEFKVGNILLCVRSVEEKRVKKLTARILDEEDEDDEE